MQIDKQINRQSSRLILFFNGWSASPDLFRRLEEPAHTDVWICYDYRDLTFDDAIAKYADIHLIAWSLGVWVAEQIGRRYPSLPIRTATAVNGTPHPIDERYGIPPALFQGTLANLSSQGIERFTRRMCGNRSIREAYHRIPARPTETVEAELHALYRLILSASSAHACAAWDTSKRLSNDLAGLQASAENPSAQTSPRLIPWSNAILSRHDRIFPPENLLRYWAGRCPISEPEAPHYPFYLWNQWQALWNR